MISIKKPVYLVGNLSQAVQCYKSSLAELSVITSPSSSLWGPSIASQLESLPSDVDTLLSSDPEQSWYKWYRVWQINNLWCIIGMEKERYGMTWLAWYSMLWYSMVWYNMAWFDMLKIVWYDMVWSVMILHHIVWWCMVQYNLVLRQHIYLEKLR